MNGASALRAADVFWSASLNHCPCFRPSVQVRLKQCHEGRDESFDTFILDEDKVQPTAVETTPFKSHFISLGSHPGACLEPAVASWFQHLSTATYTVVHAVDAATLVVVLVCADASMTRATEVFRTTTCNFYDSRVSRMDSSMGRSTHEAFTGIRRLAFSLCFSFARDSC